MVDYKLEADEIIIGVYPQNSIKRVRNKLKKSKILRLIPQKESLVQYFVIKKNMFSEIIHIKGVDERGNLKTSVFAELIDETIYPKRRSTKTNGQPKLF